MKNKNLNLFFLFLFIIVLSLSFLSTGLSPVFASKSEVILPGLGGNPTLPQYISAIFNFVLQLAGGLSLLAMLFGSLRYITSFGNPAAKNEGKQWLKSGILGLLLLMSSYLILYTINKNLVSLEISPLGIPSLVVNIPWEPGKKPAPSEMTYQEFPMGTLTENVLSRTTDCYEFDLNGDPIDAKTSTADIYEPGLTNHDQLDCALKIYEAAEKKAKISSLLSEEIAKLMETCSCAGNCDQKCSTCERRGDTCPIDESSIGTTEPCRGDCINSSCKKTPDKNTCPDVCIKNDDILDINVSTDEGKRECTRIGGRIIGIMDIIKKGPIKISIACPECGEKTYKGLDEFRVLRTKASFFVEIEKEINGKKIKVIKKNEWNQLRLVEQLMYFKEKINKIKEELKLDSDVLRQAEDKLSQCYLAKSSVDFLKITEGNDKIKNGEIIIQKIFKDPISNQDIEPSKYCKGYNYSDSSCFSFCQKICFPTANPDSIQGLKNCDADNFVCLKAAFYKCVNNAFGFRTMQECLDNPTKGCRAECSKSCDTKYLKLGTSKCPDKNGECRGACDTKLSKCLNDCNKIPDNKERKKCKDACSAEATECQASCDTEYPKCKDENQVCKDACNEDSKYILEQEQNCFGTKFQSAKNCADFYDKSDFESFKRCIESSMCFYCTDQYAGYPDCAKNIGESSSLYLYKNPSQQKCQSCQQSCREYCNKNYPTPPAKNKECNDLCAQNISDCLKYCDTKYPEDQDKNKECKKICTDTHETVEQYPECQKCPKCSICPKCPCKDGCSVLCDTEYPKDPDKNKECRDTCSGCLKSCDTRYPKNPAENKECKNICAPQNENCSQIEEKILSCSAECGDSAYNGDPLTFYCWTKWWKEAGKGSGGTTSSPDMEVIEEIKADEDIEKEEKDELIKEELGSPVNPSLPETETLYCQKGEEIPVGETVDGSEKWADDLIKFITDNVIKKLDNMIEYIKGIEKETKYCECDSKCDGKEGACQSNCVYGQAEVEDVDPETGEPTGTFHWVCFCANVPCNGNPCQKMINLLRGKKKEENCPKDTEYKGVAWYDEEIKKSLEEFKKNVGGRSDLLKKLVYSRKKMEECSAVSNIFKGEKRTISCTLTKDYFLDPISKWSVVINGKKYKKQCYGGWLGKLLGTSAPTGGLMDNWECCEKRL